MKKIASSQKSNVIIGFNKYFHVHQMSDFWFVKNENSFYDNDLCSHYFGGFGFSRVGDEIVVRDFDFFIFFQVFQMFF